MYIQLLENDGMETIIINHSFIKEQGDPTTKNKMMLYYSHNILETQPVGFGQ